MDRAPDLSRPLLPRRAVLTRIGSGLGLALVARGASAQEATPAALPPALAEWIAGWQARDPDRIAAIYAEDAVHLVVATGETIEGRAAIRDNIVALIGAVPDETLTVNQAFAAGEMGAVDWTFAGHYTNELPGFPPPAGQALMFRAVTLFALSGAQVVRTTEFYDFYGLLVQLGVLPPLPGAATPAA